PVLDKPSYSTTASVFPRTPHLTISDTLSLHDAHPIYFREAGRHIFSNTTLKTAGSQSLTATDTVTSSITGSQTGITVNAAATNSLLVGALPTPTTAAIVGTFTVTAKNPNSNTTTGSRD